MQRIIRLAELQDMPTPAHDTYPPNLMEENPMASSYCKFLGEITSRPNWGACEEAISENGFPVIETAANAADQAEIDVDDLLEDAACTIDRLYVDAESEDPGGYNDHIWRSFDSDVIGLLNNVARRITERISG